MALIKNPFAGKKNKAVSTAAPKKKKSLDAQILDARMMLEKARTQNLDVIEMELRNIRYDRQHHANPAYEARYIAKIKNAYYAMSVINNAKLRLNDIETSQELYSAMNNIGGALKLINQISKKSEKPKSGQYIRESKKLDRTMEKEKDRMENLYDKVDGIDSLVSNDVIERLIKGEMVEDCLRHEEGILFSMDDLQHFDLDEVRNLLDETEQGLETDAEEIDYQSMDFSDFQ